MIRFLYLIFSCFHQKKESHTAKIDRLKVHQIFNYADKIDIFLMVIGIIAG